MRAALSLLQKRPLYRSFWASSLVSLLGDWFSFVAISRLSLDAGGGAFSLVLTFAAHAAPAAFLSPLAGVWLDRFDRRNVLLYARLVQAGLTVLMAASAAFRSLVLLQVLVLLRSSLSAFVFPAEGAMLRRTVQRDELLLANSLDSATWSASFALGMALGGVLAMFGATTALVLDASSCVLSALLLLRLPPMPPEGAAQAQPKGAARELGEALSYVKREPALREALFAKAPVSLISGGGWLLLNLQADSLLLFGSGAVTLGVLQAIKGLGSGFGPAWLERLLPKQISRRGALHISFLLTALGVSLFAITRVGWLSVLGVFLWGVGIGGNWVFSTATMQQLSPDRYSGRLFAIDNISMTTATITGATLGALAVVYSGVLSLSVWLVLVLGVLVWGIICSASSTKVRLLAKTPF